ncbi:Protein serine/threonine phosphatase with Cache sensor [Planktothrix serta PCC 8927]|uniref:Protein serine/threonine phosphatase with Cache sensor n=1 Tax=Planktothrix serta PCC 8927 TaxID=671068 RepID=A0A7Z9BIG5_9CYAN|nr:SpoIIE family protein phosphatase [Planktothrix serta]VXD14900.1 Protein serine/threonine phosphatase with Cache sensor [Planktothrix serta PCC 8927]
MSNRFLQQSVNSFFRKISLRNLLIFPFVLQIFMAVALVGWLSFENGQQAVNDLAQKLQNEVSDRISQQLDHYLEVPIQVNEVNLNLMELGLLNSQDLDNIRRHFWKQMKVYPNLSYFNWGTVDGVFLGVGREDDGTLYLELMKATDQGRYQRYALDNHGNPTTVIATEEYPFQQDEWYSNAVTAGQPIWSQIYQWDDRPEVISIASSYPVYNQQKQLVGVMGIDLILTQISYFLKQLKVSPSSKIFILERNGLIVASSSDEKPYLEVNGESQRLSAFQSRDPLIQASSQYLLKRFNDLSEIRKEQALNFKWDGENIFVRVSPWQDQYGLNWLIVVAIPESDFMQEINANTQKTILLCLVALAIATGMGILIARWITEPILRLNRASQKITRGDLNQTVKIKQIIELTELADSFNKMANQLQDSFETLEQKVMERTAELAAAHAQILALNQRLKIDNRRMSSELELLKRMQQLILPKAEELALIEGLEIAVYMEPAYEVGGDYYDVLYMNEVVTIGIGDVTGHGLESGILMVMTQAAVRVLKEIQERDPVRFLNVLNRAIYRNVQRMNSDKNLTLAILNYKKGHLSISGQHEEILIVRQGGKVERINTMDLGLPIGLDEDISEFISQTLIELNIGDIIVLYTDGITEAKNIQKAQYGLERLCKVVSKNWQHPAEDIKKAVILDVRTFMGEQKQFDDITLLILKQR